MARRRNGYRRLLSAFAVPVGQSQRDKMRGLTSWSEHPLRIGWHGRLSRVRVLALRLGSGWPGPAPSPVLYLPNDLQLLKLLKWREVESGLGQEAAEQARSVLHPP